MGAWEPMFRRPVTTLTDPSSNAGHHGHGGGDDLGQHDVRVVMLFEATCELTEVFGELV